MSEKQNVLVRVDKDSLKIMSNRIHLRNGLRNEQKFENRKELRVPYFKASINDCQVFTRHLHFFNPNTQISMIYVIL